MKVVSVNIARPATIEWRGQQLETGIYKEAVEGPIWLGAEDVAGDHVIDRRYHGGVDKACYWYSADHYSFWQEKYPDPQWSWGMFGENLTISGLKESEIKIGDTFRIGKAVVQVTQPRQPCFKLGIRFGSQTVVDDFWNSSYPGVYVRVLEPGNVKAGDIPELTERHANSLSVSEVFSIFRSNRKNQALILQAADDPFLAESCRRDILKILQNDR
jgi:MOSC domain-containing protein YiiM